jgi:hypothetical protein
MSPLRVRIFTHSTSNIGDSSELQINHWLRDNPAIDIVNLLQSESMTAVGESKLEKNISITVFYREP